MYLLNLRLIITYLIDKKNNDLPFIELIRTIYNRGTEYLGGIPKGEKMRTRKHKLHIAHILTLSLVWLILSAGSDVALSAWQPPIGIPRPEFGIEETYRMYDDPANRNPALTYTQNAEGGFYTHYVDNTHPAATDSGNPYGTASIPRETIPLDWAAGSVVEIHGGPYTWPSTAQYLYRDSYGTLDYPVFVRGISESNRPVISSQMRANGSYLILENLDFSLGGHLVLHGDYDQDFMSIRYSEFHDSYNHAIRIDTSRNIVVYKNDIHHNGNWEATWNESGQGIALWSDGDSGGATDYIWIVDNHIHHMGEDGVHTLSYDAPYTRYPRYVYIGRNEMDHCRENAIDIKVVNMLLFLRINSIIFVLVFLLMEMLFV